VAASYLNPAKLTSLTHFRPSLRALPAFDVHFAPKATGAGAGPGALYLARRL